MINIAFSNQKGGVGKSTLVGFLAIHLVRKGHKVLVIDGDSQGNTTERLTQIPGGDELPLTGTTMADLFLPDCSDIKVMSCPLGMDLIHTPSNDLYLYDKEIIAMSETEWPKKNSRSFRQQYDYVLIDTPPTLGRILLSSLIMADKVFIPVQLSGFSMGGLEGLIGTIRSLQSGLNPDLLLGGVIVNRLRPRLSSQERTLTSLKEQLGNALLNHFLYDRNPIDTAVDEGHDINKMPYAHVAAKELNLVMEEIMERL